MLTPILIFQVTGLVTHTRHRVVPAHVPTVSRIRLILWYDYTSRLALVLNYESQNASWSINWLKVYRRQSVVGVVNAGVHSPVMQLPMLLGMATVAALSLVML
jgi:hypothetical protein